MDFMFDWEGENDRFSFEDSDRFEEDSLCSWISEPESLCNNWRGWRKQNGNGPSGPPFGLPKEEGQVTSLVELAAQAVACHIPFEVVEHFYPPIPENLQLRIAYWSFPENEEDIRLYSCLANGSADEFQKGDHLFKGKAVKEALQIGFHLSATIIPPQTLAQGKGVVNVAIVFDRRRITSCTCTCSSTASWCAHVVALCLYRIHQPNSVCLRAPVSESLNRLHRDQLQKFAQYLISELPQQILPTAQRLLDELLSSQQTAINTVCGAPDPTAGPSASEQTTWCLDEGTLHENIKKTLIKFCVPSPIVFSDVNYLSSTAPPVAAEWQSLLRPLRGREPEGMWNLLSIVREMYKRNDSNAIPLLHILTEEVLNCEQILIWWFNTKISASHNNSTGHGARNGQNSNSSSQHAASSLCDEIVTLWRLAALNPALSPIERDDLDTQVRDWHILTIDKVRKGRGNNMGGTNNTVRKTDIEIFSGFKAAIEACKLDWSDYVIPGVTYEDSYRAYWKFSHAVVSNKLSDADSKKASRGKSGVAGVITSQVLHPSYQSDHGILIPGLHRSQDFHPVSQTDGAYSSSSEGFCESDRRDSVLRQNDSDSDLGDIDGIQSAAGIQNAAKHYSEMLSGAGCERVQAKSVPGTSSASGSRGSKDVNKDRMAGMMGVLEHSSAVAAVVSGAGNANEGNVENANDEYQVYFYNGSVAKPRPEQNQEKKKKSEEPNYFAGIKPIDNKLEVLFARAEALHAHGHTHEACKLAKQLAEDMLTNPPDLSLEQPHPTGKGKKKKVQNSISSYASSTLAKAAFLCSVLLEEPECHHLAFRVGLFGLEMPRPPASSKALEVKLAYQESEMVTLLKKIPLGSSELAIIRERAEKLRDGKLKTRGEALLPLTLASFIFDSLCLPSCTVTGGLSSRVSGHSVHSSYGGPAADEKLGFEAATAALGLKANVSEADHPLLCEGTRRQRGDLAVTMLVHYKEDQEKLSKIMDKLLDKEVHQLFKAPSLSTYLSASSTSSRNTTLSPQIATPAVSQSVDAQGGTGSTHRKSPSSGCESDDSMSVRVDTPQSCSGTLVASSSCGDIQASAMVNMPNAPTSWPAGGIQAEAQDPRLEYLNLEQNFTDLSLHGHKADGNNQTGSPAGARPKTTKLYHYNSKDTDSSAVEEDTETSADYKAWAARFRCTNLKTIKKHSTGMASIDSSAPETTSSDNSPTLVRRNWTKHQGPGSDSGSSGKSSDSFGSSNSGDKLAAAKTRDNESDSCCVDSPPVPYEVRCAPQMIPYSRSSTPNIKGMRYKGKNRIMPTIPNQPSEASAHFMFELAKTVLAKAGGNSSTSLFTQPANNNNPSGPHRALHLCAFQIGLYALGLYNCVSPNWLSRTYSSHVSWITGQAMEIGSAAINILIYTWEGHLTPQEVASLADRASRGRDPNMVRAAAELALSCLPHAQALNPNEIQRALIQCKEQSQEMLERACLAVESAAKGGGVYPEVLFDVARRWYELYEESIPGSSQANQAGLAAVESEEAQIIVVAQNGVQAVAASGENTSPPMIQLVPAQSISTTGAAQGIPLQAAAVAGQAQLQPGIPVHAIPYTIPPPHNPHSQLPHHPYIAPYSYVQQIPPNFAHHYSAPHIPLHTHNIHPSYMATYPYQSQSAAFANLPHLHNTATLYHANMSHLRPPPPTTLQIAFPATTAQLQVLHNQRRLQGSLQMAPVDQASGQSALNSQQNQNQQNNVQQVQQVAPEMNIPGQNTPQFNYLLAAYRVGMLAMETQARRVHDDRPQSKYSRNPPYGEDVKWLLSMAMKLGVNYLQQFCASAVSAIVSPFVLHDIAIEAAHYLARSNPAQMTQQLRNPTLNSLMQKCLQMFIQCTHHKIHHINQTDYDDFVSIICSARNAFCMTPGGMVQFNEMLQSLRRSKSCKKELWQRIINGLSTGNV